MGGRWPPAAITFDFGNTLVPVTRATLERVVAATASAVIARSGPFAREAFLAVWHEERARQFAEDVPAGREVELERRVVRVLARLRGMAPPGEGDRWDDGAAVVLSDASERAAAVDAYSAAFVAEIPVPPEIGPLLARLALHRPLGILSNWPHAATIDRYVEAAGWAPHLRAIVVSERVGSIKPLEPIFRAAEVALGVPGERILHVGDDWAADVVGAKRAGWLAGYVRERQGDSPLPASRPDETVSADLEIDHLTDLPEALRS